MRWLGWIAALLLLANGILFAYMQLNASQHGETLAGHELINGNKIRIITASEAAALEKAKEAKPVTSAPVLGCMDWSGITAKDVDRAKKALDKLDVSGKVTSLAVPASYWVYIPPLQTMKDAEKKLGEVKKLGIEDNIRIEGEGKWRFALNLGMFATEEEATAYLDQIKSKGVKSVKSGRREGANEAVGWHIRDVDDELAAQLNQLQAGFSGSRLKPSSCN